MYSYIAGFGFAVNERTARPLSVAGDVVCNIMYASESDARVAKTLLPSVNGGWVTVLPENEKISSVIQEIHADDLSVLVHGRITSSIATAERVLETYRHGGCAAVRALGGAFFAVIVEHQSKKVVFCSDLVGHMAAHFTVFNGELVVSPHEVGLVAATDCPITLDTASALSMTVFDWSLGGRSMLSDVEVTSSLHWYEWHDGRLTVHDVNPFGERESRNHGIHQDASDVDVSPLLEETMSHLVTETRAICDEAKQVTVYLTGGMDSRLILALINASGTRTPINALTIGTSWSMDVVLARALSGIVKIPHKRIPYEQPNLTDFMSEIERYAFHFNGDTNCKRALRQFQSSPGEIRLTSGAGEIFRGYYYESAGETAETSKLEIADNIWQKVRKRRSAVLGLADNATIEIVNERLSNAFSEYNAFAETSYDLLDAFYLFERYARWGSLVARRVWLDVRSPMASPTVIRTAFQMPSPIGAHCKIHEKCISKFLPRTGYWLPINLRRVLPIKQPLLTKPIAKLGEMTDKLLRRADARVTTSPETVLSGPFFDVVRDHLSQSNGVTTSLFGAKGAADLLESFRRAPRPWSDPVSYLLSVEIWLKQIRKAKASAAGK